MSKAKREPRLVPYVLQAIVDSQSNRRSNLKNIVDLVEATHHALGKIPKNLEAQVKHALKHVVDSGLVTLRKGRFKMNSSGNSSKRRRVESPDLTKAVRQSDQFFETTPRKHRKSRKESPRDDDGDAASDSEWSEASRDNSPAIARSRSRRRHRRRSKSGRRRRRRSRRRSHASGSSKAEEANDDWGAESGEVMEGPLMRREDYQPPKDSKRKRYICNYQDCDSPCCVLPDYASQPLDHHKINKQDSKIKPDEQSKSYIN